MTKLEKEVKRLIATGMTEAEARETAEYDFKVDHDEETEYDLTEEQKKVEKKMKSTGTRKTEYQFKPRDKKIDTEKIDIIKKIFEFADSNFQNAKIANPTQKVDFEINGTNFTISLTRHRPNK